MKFRTTYLIGEIELDPADYAVLCEEDGDARADGATLSSVLEDMPEVFSLDYFYSTQPPVLTLKLRANPLGGAPDLGEVFGAISEHVAACHESAKQ